MSSSWAGSVDGADQLGQQRLEADPQLQRRLAVAAGVEVGPGAQQQRLAGVDPLAPAEDRGGPLLGAQLFGAPASPRGAGRPDVDLPRRGEAPGRDLVAAAVADPHRHRPLRGSARARAGRRSPPPWAWSARLSRSIPSSTSVVDRVLGLERLARASAAASRLVGEGLEGPDRGRPGSAAAARARRPASAGARAAPSARGGGGAPSRLDDQHALRRPRRLPSEPGSGRRAAAIVPANSNWANPKSGARSPDSPGRL